LPHCFPFFDHVFFPSGSREAAVNQAEGQKTSQILKSEAEQQEQINLAQGQSSAIRVRAEASAVAIERIAIALRQQGGIDAVSLTVAEKYVEAFGQLAKQGTTIVVPANAGDAASMVAQAMSVYDSIRATRKPTMTAIESGNVSSSLEVEESKREGTTKRPTKVEKPKLQ
jgi:hypothetical protein